MGAAIGDPFAALGFPERSMSRRPKGPKIGVHTFLIAIFVWKAQSCFHQCCAMDPRKSNLIMIPINRYIFHPGKLAMQKPRQQLDITTGFIK